MQKNSSTPDTDESARKKHEYKEESATEIEPIEDVSKSGLITSQKSGKKSSAQKLAASRPEFGRSPGDHPVPGAFGDPAKDRPAEGSLPRDKADRPKP